MKRPLWLVFVLCIACQPAFEEDFGPEVVMRQSGPNIPGRMMGQIRSEGRREAERIAGRLELDRARGLLETRSGQVPVDGVTAARIEVSMREGILELEAGEQDLLQAEFELLPESREPLVTYRTGETGRFVTLWDRGRNDHWQMKLPERLPTSFFLESEGGYRELDFKHVQLAELELRALKGNSVLSFDGYQPVLTDIRVTQARGSISLDLFGDYPDMQTIFLDTAYGNIAGSFSGYFSRLNRVTVISTNGDIDLSFDGAWQQICEIDITATCGNCRLKIPCGLGVAIRVAECSKNVDAEGLELAWPNNAYVNPAYGKSEISLNIRVRSSGGKIEVYSEDRGEVEPGELLFSATL